MIIKIINRYTKDTIIEADINNLQGADLQGADLREADLREADLWETDLRGADLQGANLRGTDLRGAGLQGANLREADLQGADLREADLWGANLDFSVWFLGCKSFSVKCDLRLAAQLAYHFCRLICDNPDFLAAKAALIPLANQFHRVNECGKILE